MAKKKKFSLEKWYDKALLAIRIFYTLLILVLLFILFLLIFKTPQYLISVKWGLALIFTLVIIAASLTLTKIFALKKGIKLSLIDIFLLIASILIISIGGVYFIIKLLGILLELI